MSSFSSSSPRCLAACVFVVFLGCVGAATVDPAPCTASQAVTFPNNAAGKMTCTSMNQCSSCAVGCDDTNTCAVSCENNENTCNDMVITCPDDADCTVTCGAFKGCKNLRVICPSNAAKKCTVTCSAQDSCIGLIVTQKDASKGAPLDIDCGSGACAGAKITCPKDRTCQVACQYQACKDAAIDGPTGSGSLTMECLQQGCQGADLRCPGNAACDVKCKGEDACKSSTISSGAPGTGAMAILCDTVTSCESANVICPLAADCKLECSAYQSCKSTDIDCGGSGRCDVLCSAGESCEGIDVTSDRRTGGVTAVICPQYLSCKGSNVDCGAADTCYQDCESSSCTGVVLKCQDPKTVCDLTCTGYESCKSSNYKCAAAHSGGICRIDCNGSASCKPFTSSGKLSPVKCSSSNDCSTALFKLSNGEVTNSPSTISPPGPTNPPDTQPPATQPPDTQPPDTQPPATQPPATQPPATTAPLTQVPATQPPATQPPATQPPATQAPATQPPATQPPATQPPATQAPVTQPPATQAPATQPPATQPPATQPPATQPPVTQPPATQPPLTLPPATQAPKTKAPPTNAPRTGVPGIPPTPAPPTDAPPTQPPATPAPATNAPPTGVPGVPPTPAPPTPAPPTNAPATLAPRTPAPPTGFPGVPTTDAPATEAPDTAAPDTAAPRADPTTAPTAAPTAEPTATPKLGEEQQRTATPPLLQANEEMGIAVTASSTAAITGTGAAGRLAVLKNFGCEVDDVDLSEGEPLDWEFHPTGVALGNSTRKYMKGALVMNPVLLIALLLLLSVISAVLHSCMHVPMKQAFGNARTPGLLYIPYLFLLQGTSLVSARMAFYPSDEAAGVVFGAWVMLVACVTSPALLYFFLLRKVKTEAYQIADPVLYPRDDIPTKLYSGRKATLYKFVYGDKVWVSGNAEGCFVERFGAVFECYREGYVTFPVVELSLMNFLSILSAWRPSDSTQCNIRNTFVCLMFFAFLAVLCFLRPYSSIFDNGMAMLLAACMFFAVLLMTIGLWVGAASTTTWFVFAANLLLISAFLLLIKALWDLFSYGMDIWLGRKSGARQVHIEETRMYKLKQKMRAKAFGSGGGYAGSLAGGKTDSDPDCLSEHLLGDSMNVAEVSVKEESKGGAERDSVGEAANPLSASQTLDKDPKPEKKVAKTGKKGRKAQVANGIIITCVAEEGYVPATHFTL